MAGGGRSRKEMQQFQSDQRPSWLPNATVADSWRSEKKTKRIPASDITSKASPVATD